eukprot:2189077-Prymnesium_polylepis.1
MFARPTIHHARQAGRWPGVCFGTGALGPVWTGVENAVEIGFSDKARVDHRTIVPSGRPGERGATRTPELDRVRDSLG